MKKGKVKVGERIIEKKKMGRPTNNPKTIRLEIRLSEQENNMLLECSEKTGLNRTETILKGLCLLKEKLDNSD